MIEDNEMPMWQQKHRDATARRRATEIHSDCIQRERANLAEIEWLREALDIKSKALRTAQDAIARRNTQIERLLGQIPPDATYYAEEGPA